MPRIGRARKPNLNLAAAIRHANATIALREDYYPASGTLSVDRTKGVIYRVKVLGPDSQNRHGKPVDGTDYLASAHVSLAESIRNSPGGLRVNKNHTERSNPNRDRTIGERIGWLENPVTEGRDTYADLHLLAADPDSAKIFEAAERNPRCFALSINADGHFEIKDRRLIIDRFVKAHSVDIVTDGGSTVSLAESNRTSKGKPPMKLQEALEAIALSKKDIARLYEMGDGLLKPEMAADEPPEAESEDYATHLGKAVVAILNDESLEQDAKKKKILAILKLTGDEDTSGTVDTEESDDESDSEDDDMKKKEAEVAAKESLEAKVRRLEQSEAVTTLCESLSFQPTAIQRKALVALSESADRKDLIKTWQAAGKDEKRKGTGPVRSSAGNERTVRTQESAERPKDAAAQAKMLLRAS